MNYRESNPDERQAALDSHYANAEHEFELRGKLADESRERSPFADMIFEVAKANVLASQSAFDGGYAAARRDEIYLVDGIKALLGLLQLVCSRDDMPADIKYALETNHRVQEAKDALARVGQ